MSKIKVIIQEQTVLAGTAAGAYEKRLELGQESKEVLGYYLLVLKNGGLIPEQCKVAYANASRGIFESVGLGHLMVSQSVQIKDRFFREEPFEINGFINSKLTTPSLTLSDLVIQHILLVKVD